MSKQIMFVTQNLLEWKIIPQNGNLRIIYVIFLEIDPKKEYLSFNFFSNLAIFLWGGGGNFQEVVFSGVIFLESFHRTRFTKKIKMFPQYRDKCF